MPKCNRCQEYFSKRELIDWLEDNEHLSPSFCANCYDYILENYEDGDDIESME